MESAKQQAAAIGLEEVLRGLSVDGTDALHDALRRHRGARAAARLACKALRQAVDVGARKLKIKLKPTHRRRWEQGQPPPSLARWPRCCTVDVLAFETDSYDEDDHEGWKREEDEEHEDVDIQEARLLLLPFLNLHETPGAAERITHITLRGERVVNAEAAVAMLPWLLPALRCVRLYDLRLSSSPLELRFMFAALAAMPQLTELHLPVFDDEAYVLEHVGPLARSSSLQRLVIKDCEDVGCYRLSASAAAAIASLRGLRELEFSCLREFDSRDGFRCLLDAPPPSLTSLRVVDLWLHDEPATLSATLEQGRLLEVEAGVDGLMYQDTLAWMAQLLLGCRAMPPRLRALHLHVRLDVVEEDSLPLLLRPEEWDCIRSLIQRCDSVHFHRLWAGENLLDATVHQAIDVLGRPRSICLRYDLGYVTSCGLGGENEAAAAAAAATAPIAAAPLGPMPEPRDVLCAALRRLPPKSDRLWWTTKVWLLCLVGPAVEEALEDATALRSWVQGLCAAGVSSSSGDGGRLVTAYQPLPPAGALVLECPSEAAAAAVAAAAGMQGVQRAAEPYSFPVLGAFSNALSDVTDVLNEEIEDRWPAGHVRAASDEDWLRLVAWLLRARDMMHGLPREVKL